MSSAAISSFLIDIRGDEESDLTDYEDVEGNNGEVHSDDENNLVALQGIKRNLKEEEQEQMVEREEQAPAPVQYNNSKYFKKKKVSQQVEIAGCDVVTVPSMSSSADKGVIYPFFGRYFQQTKMETTEVRVEYVEPGARESVTVDWIKNEPDSFIKLEHSDSTVTIKEESVDCEPASVKLEPSDAFDGGGEGSLAAAKLEIVFKEEPPEAEQDNCDGRLPTRSTESVQLASDVKAETDGRKDDDELSPRDLLREQRLDQLRTWTKTSRLAEYLESGSRRMQPDTMGFRILSFNILAPAHVERQQQRLFGRRPAALLAWSRRWRGVQRQVDTLRPDIVCLQEVPFLEGNTIHADVTDYFDRRGYYWLGRGRRPDAAHGCAIFYRRAMFTLDAWKAVKNGADAQRRRTVGVICRLRPTDVAVTARLVVASVHLMQGRRHFVNRLADVAVLLADLDELAYQDGNLPYHPVLVAGDFNIEPFTDIYRLITKGNLNYKVLKYGDRHYPPRILPPSLGLPDCLQWEANLALRGQSQLGIYSGGRCWHSFDFRSAYRFRAERDLYKGAAPPESEVSTYQGSWINVDYIFYSTIKAAYSSADGKAEKNLKLLANWSLPTASDMRRLGGLPSAICPSDHLPLAADFLLVS